MSANGGSTMYYAGFQGCNGDRPQCCPWPVDASSVQDAGSLVTAEIELEPEFELKRDPGNDYPRPAHGYKTRLKSCPDDYYSVSGGCCPAYVFSYLNPFCFSSC